MKPVRAWIGLGSNLDGPEAQLQRALEALDRLPRSRVVACSSFYRSAPMGPADQPDYVNAVAALDTGLSPLELLDALQAVEAAQGRVRGPERWGPRTLDLDILLYGAERIDTPRLKVPHPGMAQRPFVLWPLAEVAPGLEIPGLGPLDALLTACPREGLRRLEAGA